MQLDELKKSMSTLEQVLAKTSTDIKINVTVSQTAKAKILKKFRQSFISCLILAVVFAAAIAGGINNLSFPVSLKIYLVIYLLLAAVWYMYMYLKLRRIDIVKLAPAKLFSETANVKMLMLSGEIFFGVGIVILFTLLFPKAWTFNRVGFWAMAVTLVAALVFSILHYWPQYIKLFRDLNSIKEKE